MPFARPLVLALLCLSLAACNQRPVQPAEIASPANGADNSPPEQVVHRPVESQPAGREQGAPATVPRVVAPPQIVTAPPVAVNRTVLQQTEIRASTVPPKWSGVVLRLEFLFPEKHLRHTGTGFIVRDRADDCYLLTCAHLVDKKDWETRHSVTMRFMNNQKVIHSLGPSLYIGNPVDLKHLGSNGRPDMTHDFVIRSVVGNWARPLPLAPADPKVGDRVWAVGCEAGQPDSDEKLFPGEMVEVTGGGYTLKKRVTFNPRGFSGGPVVNQKGQVIGNVLAGGGDFISGATVGTIRRRLREKGIVID
jgi:S1-C subfamily serine protease